MAFLLVVPSITIRCETVFGLTVVWVHPHQAHFPTLLEVAHKHVLLVDISKDWPYAFVQLNDTMSYAPLLKEGYINAMMDGTSSVDAHSWLHQLHIHKLLQHGEKVVCL